MSPQRRHPSVVPVHKFRVPTATLGADSLRESESNSRSELPTLARDGTIRNLRTCNGTRPGFPHAGHSTGPGTDTPSETVQAVNEFSFAWMTT